MMARYQVNVTVGEQLREAILFVAAREGLAPSTKIRQILHQQLQRTIHSPEFAEHLLGQAARQRRIGGSNDGG